MTKLNILLIRKLNIFVEFSQRFVIIVNNIDNELIKRREKLQSIQIDNKSNIDEGTVNISYNGKEFLFVILQKLIQLYIDHIIKPIIKEIPKNKIFKEQIRLLEQANDKLIISQYSTALIHKYIKKYSKELNYNLRVTPYKNSIKKISKNVKL